MPSRSKAYEVKITDTAWGHLLEHARFLANVNVSAANRLVDDFMLQMATLVQMPERCPWLTHEAIPFQRYRKIFFGKYYMALFEVRGNAVFITAVVDTRQDYAWLL